MVTYRRTLISNQLKENLALWVSSALLDAGYYGNISKGETDFEGTDLSKLLLDTSDTSFTKGKVWKAPRNNWIHESGVSIPSGAVAPIQVSGVYVNNTFYLPNHATYGHYIDYPKGRIVFTSTISTTATVQVEYSYKEFDVRETDANELYALHNDYAANTGITSPSFPFNEIITPAIIIDVADHELKPLALGGGKIIQKIVHFHVVSNDVSRHKIRDIADFISYRQNEAINLVDVDKAPERLTFRGSKSSTYKTWKQLLADSSLFLNRAYLLAVDQVKIPTSRPNWHRIRLDCLIEVRGLNE